MDHASGKFVLRLDPSLHQRLREEAKAHHVSLNTWIVRHLQNPQETTNQLWYKIKSVYKDKVIGLVQFGSTVRGENQVGSDIDLLLVITPQIEVNRDLYSLWDREIAPQFKAPFSPQFSHRPESGQPSSL